LRRKYRATKAGTAPNASKNLQVNSRVAPAEMRIKPSKDENNIPTPCIEKTPATILPRTLESEPSDAIVADSGYSPPIPIPNNVRYMASCVTRDTVSDRTQAALKIDPIATRDPVINTPVLLPIQSPIKPNNSIPNTAPMEVADAIKDFEDASLKPIPYPFSTANSDNMDNTKSITNKS
jgi:hypothetical protein